MASAAQAHGWQVRVLQAAAAAQHAMAGVRAPNAHKNYAQALSATQVAGRLDSARRYAEAIVWYQGAVRLFQTAARDANGARAALARAAAARAAAARAAAEKTAREAQERAAAAARARQQAEQRAAAAAAKRERAAQAAAKAEQAKQLKEARAARSHKHPAKKETQGRKPKPSSKAKPKPRPKRHPKPRPTSKHNRPKHPTRKAKPRPKRTHRRKAKPATVAVAAMAGSVTWPWGVLSGIGAPKSNLNYDALYLWAQSEGMPADTNNWLATTLPEPGATPWNSAGVKVYPSQAEGIRATVSTLLHSSPSFGYGAIVAAMRRGGTGRDIWRAINNSSWCSGCQGGRYPVDLYDRLGGLPAPTGGRGQPAHVRPAYFSPIGFTGGRAERVDQGVDYGGATGNLLAIANGRVTHVVPGGWGRFGNLVEYVITQPGDLEGLSVYYAEGVRSLVHEKQLLHGGQAVAEVITDWPSGIEIGWASGRGDGHTYAYEHGGWTPEQDSGNYSTVAGENFNSIIRVLGGRPGIVGAHTVPGSAPPGAVRFLQTRAYLGTGPAAPVSPRIPATPTPAALVANESWEALIRQQFYWLGVHGGRAKTNTAKALALVMGTKYVTTTTRKG